MSGPYETHLLQQIAAILCCLSKRFDVDPVTPPAPSVTVLTMGVSSSTPFTVSLPYTSATSLEIENFSATDWLSVTLPSPGGQLFYVPPGGSKVIAFSTPSTEICGTATVGSCVDASGTAGFTSTFYVQVTSIQQP